MHIEVEIFGLEADKAIKHNRYAMKENMKTIKFFESQMSLMNKENKERIQLSIAAMKAENKKIQTEMPMWETLRKTAWN